MVSGVLSDFGARPELADPGDVERRLSSARQVRVIGPRPDFQTLALWFGTIPLLGWEDELARASRHAINPMFARINWDREEDVAAVSPTDVPWAFEHLRRQAKDILADYSAGGGNEGTSPVQLFVDLPDFPVDSPSAAQQDYFDHLLSLTEALTLQFRRPGNLTLVGLPAEQYVAMDSIRPSDLAWLVRRSTGVSVSWSLGSSSTATGDSEDLPRRSFEDRMRDIEEGQGIQSTYCLGKNLGGKPETEGKRVRPERGGDCIRKSGSSLFIAWSGAPTSLLPVSDFRRFLKLTGMVGRNAEDRLLPATVARIRTWPQPEPILQSGDVVDAGVIGDTLMSSDGSGMVQAAVRDSQRASHRAGAGGFALSDANRDKDDRLRPPLVGILIRLCWPMLVQDVAFPGSGWLLDRMTAAERQRLGRERISYQIRTADYRLGIGPFWLKRAAQRAHELRLAYGFWFVALAKIVMSLTVVALPIGLVVLFRVILPNPAELIEGQERLRTALFHNRSQPHSRAQLAPYALGGDTFGWRPPLAGISASDTIDRLPDLFPEVFPLGGGPSDPGAMPYLLLNRVRFSDAAPFAARAVAFGAEGFPVSLNLKTSDAVEILGSNRIVGHYMVLSAQKASAPMRCRLEVRDESGRVLLSVEKSPGGTPRRSGWIESLLGRPGRRIAEGERSWEAFRFRSDTLPRRLTYTVREVQPQMGAGEGAAAAVRSAAEPGGMEARPSCVVALTSPVFEKRTLHPPNVRTVVVAIVDGVWEPLSRDPEIMPHLASWVAEGATGSSLHFSTSAEPGAAIRELLGIGIASGGSDTESLMALARRSGFRTGYFGDADDVYFADTETVRGHDVPDVLMGFPLDGVRGAAAQSQAFDWLTFGGAAPALAVVRLSDVRGKWIPPWSALRLKDVLAAYSGYGRRAKIYESMLRALDDNLGSLRKSLGRLDNGSVHGGAAVQDLGARHLVVVGSSGVSAALRPVAIGGSEGSYAAGATFALGGLPRPESLHVPLVVSTVPPAHKTTGEHQRISTHRELRGALAQVLEGKSSGVLAPQAATLPAAVGSSRMPAVMEGSVGAPAQSGAVRFWVPRLSDRGEIVQLAGFPLSAAVRVSLGRGHWDYDTVQGNLDAVPADESPDLYGRHPESWQKLTPAVGPPALMIVPTGEGAQGINMDIQIDRPVDTHRAAAGDLAAAPTVGIFAAPAAVDGSVQELTWPESLGRRQEPRSIAVTGLMTASNLFNAQPLPKAGSVGTPIALVVKGLGSTAKRLRIAAEGGISLCQIPVPGAVLDLEQAQLERLMRDPPPCAFSGPGRRWYDRKPREPDRSVYEVWVGWP